MKVRRIVGTLICCLGFASVAGLTHMFAQRGPQVLSSKPLASLDLGPELPGMQGRRLHMRMMTMIPGGRLSPHTHADRPSIIYVFEGKLIEHRGDVTEEYGPGQAFSIGKETTHWSENPGTAPMSYIEVEITKLP